MFTEGLMLIPLPIPAPNILSKQTFNPEKGNRALLKINALVKYQRNCFNLPAAGFYHALSNFERFTILVICGY